MPRFPRVNMVCELSMSGGPTRSRTAGGVGGVAGGMGGSGVGGIGDAGGGVHAALV